MGSLDRFHLEFFIRRYGCRYFVETGTGLGSGIVHAVSFPGFQRCFSCEIMEELFERVRHLNHHSRLVIEHASSEAFLRKWLPQLDPQVPCLFWLDAHYPGADFGLRSWWAEGDTQIRLPLETELQTIRDLRPDSQDVLLIDDLRIYEDDKFEDGNLPLERHTLPPHLRNARFVDRLFKKTHWIVRSTWDDGYLVLLPREKAAAFYQWILIWQREKWVRAIKKRLAWVTSL